MVWSTKYEGALPIENPDSVWWQAHLETAWKYSDYLSHKGSDKSFHKVHIIITNHFCVTELCNYLQIAMTLLF